MGPSSTGMVDQLWSTITSVNRCQLKNINNICFLMDKCNTYPTPQPRCGALMKCIASSGINQIAFCLLSPFCLHHTVCLLGMLSINIKAEITLIEQSDVTFCSRNFISYENTQEVPMPLGMLIIQPPDYSHCPAVVWECGRVMGQCICHRGNQVLGSQGCCSPPGLGRQRLETRPTNVRDSTCCHE